MSRSILTGTIFALAFAILSVATAETRPILLAQNVAPEVRKFACAVELNGGWAAGVGSGLIFQSGDTWLSQKTPNGAEVRVVEQMGTGLVVAGPGFAFLVKGQKWQPLDINDEINYGATDGRRVLLIGGKGVYSLEEGGKVELLRSHPRSAHVTVHAIDGNMIVTSDTDVCANWANGRLSPAPTAYRFLDYKDIVTIQVTGKDRYVVAGGGGIIEVVGPDHTQIFPNRRSDFVKHGLVGAFQFGDKVVVGTFFGGGIEILSRKTGLTEWKATENEIGSVYFMTEYMGGLLIGTSLGLYVMPDPSAFALSVLPKGDLYFVGSIHDEPVIGLTSGAFSIDGSRLPYTAAPEALLEMRDGRVVRGEIGALVVGGEVVALPSRDVVALGEIPGKIVVLTADSVMFVDGNQLQAKIETRAIKGVSNSLAIDGDGKIFVGTSDGAYELDSTGTILAHLGKGSCRALQTGTSVLWADGEGGLYRGEQKFLTINGGRIFALTIWKGKLVGLVEFSEGRYCGEIDTKNSTWKPFELPQLSPFEGLFVRENTLYVVCGDQLLAVNKAQYLEPPSSAFGIAQVGSFANVRSLEQVGSDVAAVDVLFGERRLRPWQNAEHALRVDGAEWEEGGLASRMTWSRLQWGKDQITVRATRAGMSSETSLFLRRDLPWWLSLYAIFGYVVLLTTLVTLSFRIYTRELNKRAERLRKIVEEQTTELRQASMAREEFFSSISHEIRNPLNGVVGLCDMLHAIPSDELATKHRLKVNTLKGCADQLRSILGDVLDFTQIDRGTIQLNEEIFDLSDAVEGAARSVDIQLAKCTVVTPGTGIWVSGDKGKFRQIAANMVSNAIKYGVPPHAFVTAEVEPRADGSVTVSVSVKNTGNTIAPGDIARIFDGFVRTKDALSRRIPGSGLGLATSRRIAKAMGGNVTARSENGLTEFRATVILRPSVAPATTRPEDIQPQVKSRALAIEDEVYNRMVLGWHLGQLGFEVDWAESGADALAMIETAAYDIILTDFVLPDTTGDVLARELLKRIPDPKPPIVAVTAYSTPEKIKQALDAGISSFISKPISREKLKAAIMGGEPTISAARSYEKPERYDFVALLRMNEGRRALAEFADSVGSHWATLVQAISNESVEPERLRKDVHGLKSKVLVAHASELAEQLALLEDAIEDRRPVAETSRLAAVIWPMIEEIVEAARSRAYEAGAISADS